MRAFLHGFGMHVPERVVTNAEIAARVERTPEWIEGACGIRERRLALAGPALPIWPSRPRTIAWRVWASRRPPWA